MSRSRTPNQSETSTGRAKSARVVTHEDIAQLAYTIYENRNREDGHDLEDWLQAERDLQHDSQEKDVA